MSSTRPQSASPATATMASTVASPAPGDPENSELTSSELTSLEIASSEIASSEITRVESTVTAKTLPEEDEDKIPIPDVSHLITEDDTPVDNLIQEKLQRFLVECLYSSLKLDIPFLAAADLGLFYGIDQTESLAPDVLLSLGVSVPEDWSEKRKRSYFVWEFGKPPDVAIEIVSNRKGGELSDKLQKYARIGIPYYVVFDPLEKLSPQILQIYVLHGGCYQPLQDTWLESIGLGLTVWSGEFEGKSYHRWLRWCDGDGNLLLTGNEQARQERQQAEQERQQTEQERQRAERAEQQLEQERQRSEHLAALLRKHGLSPEESHNTNPEE